ncbi:hypothetical protein MMC10_009944 [Thelotrema lepadinum]|nr:hypothetical protein [Thelotrema lepadinum]
MAESSRPLLPKGALPKDPPLPAPASSPPDLPHKQKRKLTLAACEPCRKRKSKASPPSFSQYQFLHCCDGNRPCCSACVSKPDLCIFEIKDANISRTTALKQKVEILEAEAQEMSGMIDDLQINLNVKSELLEYLKTRPSHEAQTILERWRNSQDVDSVVQYVRDGDLLIQSFNNPGSSGKSPDDFGRPGSSNQ